MTRGTPRLRLAPAIFGPILLLLSVAAGHGEEPPPWARYQKEFAQLYAQRAAAKLQDARSRNDAAETARWERAAAEAAKSQTGVVEIRLDGIETPDRCTTCHRGIDDPLMQDAPQPLRPHPGDLLKVHDVARFGCTPCHDGQGAATTVEGAHGDEAGWPTPLRPAAYLQASCTRCHEVTHGVKGAEVVSRGTDLFMEKGCYGCHDMPGIAYQPKFAPPLSALKSKLADAKTWTYAWTKDPARLSHDTAMPKFELSDEAAGKMTAFLLSLTGGKKYERVALGNASAKDGERLFTERGCRGCHGVKADERSVSPRVPHLAGVGSKVTPEWLDRWIADPRAYNPDTAMPKTELTDAERRALVAYLMTLKRSEPLPAAPDLAKLDPAEGKELVKQYECFGCHAIEGFEQVRPSVPDLAALARKPLGELEFGATQDVAHTRWDWLRRKLVDPRAYDTEKAKLKMPKTSLADDEAQALVTSVLAFEPRKLPAGYAVRATPEKQARREASWMVAHLSCNGCHRINERPAHVAQFLERKSLTPPTLDGVGGRLQGQYMYQFLLEPKAVRPWLTIRMPSFGFTEAQARTLVDGLAAAAGATNSSTYVAREEIAPEHFQRGIKRFRHYKCVQCHPTSIDQGLPEGVDPDDLSINLMLSKTRLRADWLRDFMARPKQIAGNETRMPTVFYSVDGEPKVEKPKEDIDDITTYLMGMSEPPEVTLKAEEESRKAEQQQPDWSKVQY